MLHLKTFKIKSKFVVLSLYSEKWPKMAMFMRAGKWEGVMPLPLNFCFVNSYDLKFMSFKFGNDIFVTFEMPRAAYTMILQKITSPFYYL